MWVWDGGGGCVRASVFVCVCEVCVCVVAGVLCVKWRVVTVCVCEVVCVCERVCVCVRGGVCVCEVVCVCVHVCVLHSVSMTPTLMSHSHTPLSCENRNLCRKR